MLREIKYRGKTVSDGTTWVEGGYYKHEKVTLCPMGLSQQDILDNELHLIIRGGFSDWNLPAALQCYEVLPETVGLFSGICDINKKEIYEGDIYDLDGDRYIVVWSGVSLIGKQVKGEKYSELPKCYTQIEIIGNATDNPELLA